MMHVIQFKLTENIKYVIWYDRFGIDRSLNFQIKELLDVRKPYRLCKDVEYLYYVLIDYCLLSYDKLYNNVIKLKIYA